MKIVAPAGNLERFYSAVNAGADEIYMGIKGFGARRNAQNFTLEEYKEAIDYAHKRGSRIFLTLNTLMKNVEIDFLYTNLKALYEYGLDAIIVQDLGYFRFIKENFPDIDIHGSTQMTVANHVEAEYLKSLGFKRVVLPREMTFEEIKSIREKTDIELEVFVSGALCISYSGNCYMSSFIGGRSGNRGMCAQPCRKIYTKDSKCNFLLSPKDQLMGLEEIQKLKEIGINSIKIEGRMKEKTYVNEAVTYFRDMIDNINREEKLSKIFNRGYSKGYFYKETVSEDIMNKNYSATIGNPIGIISGKELLLEDRIMLGDGITYLSKDYEILGGEYINRIEKKNQKEKYKEAVEGEKIILKNAPKGSKFIFKNFDKKVIDEVTARLKEENKKENVELTFEGRLGEKPLLKGKVINSRGQEIYSEIIGESLIEVASKKSADSKNIEEKLCETGETVFKVSKCNVYIDNNIFLPISILKELRRNLLKELEEKLVLSYRRNLGEREIFKIQVEKDEIKTPEISVMVTTKEQEEIVKELGIEKIYHRGYDVAKEGNLKYININEKLATNLYQILKNTNKDVTVGWNLNVGNIYSLNEFAKIPNVKTIIISPELKYEEIENIGKVPVRKAMLGYSKLKGMYIELDILKDKETFKNEQEDLFISRINPLGNNEIYFNKPLNVLSQVKRLGKLGIDEVVIELLDESKEEIEEIIRNIDKKENIYSPYNYERGVY
ncbi:MAG: U32 family peptidase [Fusobacterium perfoetens]|uniref:peptidase U32 family protein n=1 Tax=Fusobacterium perfoetens TaxID=852 RepID=UPI0023F22A1D|nr:U32 family peptidase [Fusobacterium perfoetens]MCI6153363.1 U32 family peptidase [Fusobacterium perfoetens]MDY3236514.1 U32 family peptidase [Fusobacterium perfoetens]